VLLVHEMSGVGQAARFGCEFASFFSCAKGATPPELLSRGIYSSVAVPLKGGLWREASMALLGMALGMSKEEAEYAKEGHDVLGLIADTELLAHSIERIASKSLAGAHSIERIASKSLAVASRSLASSRQAASRMRLGGLPNFTCKPSSETSATAISVSVVSAAEPISNGKGAGL